MHDRTGTSGQASASGVGGPHPLDPLGRDELEQLVTALREGGDLGPDVRLIAADLDEPSKDELAGWSAGEPILRRAKAVLLDPGVSRTSEVLVSLTDQVVLDRHPVAGVRPAIHPDEAVEGEAAVKRDPAFREALAKRDIRDLDLVMVDIWSLGNFGDPDDGRRLAKGLAWLLSEPSDNGYAHPIEGLVAVVDLNAMAVVRVDDHGVVPIPSEDGNYAAGRAGPVRGDLRALEIEQPDGPSFEVDGFGIRWQGWHLRVGCPRCRGAGT